MANSDHNVDTLPDRTVFNLDSEASERFQAALNAPPKVLPRMRELLRGKGAIDLAGSGRFLRHGLLPEILPTSKVLILGSLPGEESILKQQYYARSSNHFWRILGEVYGESIGTEYSDKLTFLFSRGLALWDVLASAEREGSLDSFIKGAVSNSLDRLVAAHPNLKAIVLNGGRAKKEFVRYRKTVPGSGTVWPKVFALPSSSATPGRNVKSFDEKVLCWSLLARLSAEPSPIADYERYDSSIFE